MRMFKVVLLLLFCSSSTAYAYEFMLKNSDAEGWICEVNKFKESDNHSGCTTASRLISSGISKGKFIGDELVKIGRGNYVKVELEDGVRYYLKGRRFRGKDKMFGTPVIKIAKNTDLLNYKQPLFGSSTITYDQVSRRTDGMMPTSNGQLIDKQHINLMRQLFESFGIEKPKDKLIDLLTKVTLIEKNNALIIRPSHPNGYITYRLLNDNLLKLTKEAYFEELFHKPPYVLMPQINILSGLKPSYNLMIYSDRGVPRKTFVVNNKNKAIRLSTPKFESYKINGSDVGLALDTSSHSSYKTMDMVINTKGLYIQFDVGGRKGVHVFQKLAYVNEFDDIGNLHALYRYFLDHGFVANSVKFQEIDAVESTVNREKIPQNNGKTEDAVKLEFVHSSVHPSKSNQMYVTMNYVLPSGIKYGSLRFSADPVDCPPQTYFDNVPDVISAHRGQVTVVITNQKSDCIVSALRLELFNSYSEKTLYSKIVNVPELLLTE